MAALGGDQDEPESTNPIVRRRDELRAEHPELDAFASDVETLKARRKNEHTRASWAGVSWSMVIDTKGITASAQLARFYGWRAQQDDKTRLSTLAKNAADAERRAFDNKRKGET